MNWHVGLMLGKDSIFLKKKKNSQFINIYKQSGKDTDNGKYWKRQLKENRTPGSVFTSPQSINLTPFLENTTSQNTAFKISLEGL